MSIRWWSNNNNKKNGLLRLANGKLRLLTVPQVHTSEGADGALYSNIFSKPPDAEYVLTKRYDLLSLHDPISLSPIKRWKANNGARFKRVDGTHLSTSPVAALFEEVIRSCNGMRVQHYDLAVAGQRMQNAVKGAMKSKNNLSGIGKLYFPEYEKRLAVYWAS